MQGLGFRGVGAVEGANFLNHPQNTDISGLYIGGMSCHGSSTEGRLCGFKSKATLPEPEIPQIFGFRGSQRSHPTS